MELKKKIKNQQRYKVILFHFLGFDEWNTLQQEKTHGAGRGGTHLQPQDSGSTGRKKGKIKAYHCHTVK